jgi:chromosome segregation ATPase
MGMVEDIIKGNQEPVWMSRACPTGCKEPLEAEIASLRTQLAEEQERYTNHLIDLNLDMSKLKAEFAGYRNKVKSECSNCAQLKKLALEKHTLGLEVDELKAKVAGVRADRDAYREQYRMAVKDRDDAEKEIAKALDELRVGNRLHAALTDQYTANLMDYEKTRVALEKIVALGCIGGSLKAEMIARYALSGEDDVRAALEEKP